MPINAQIQQLVEVEAEHQAAMLSLVASENYVPKGVIDALGSPLTNVFLQGYPGKRLHGGSAELDQLERDTQDAAKAVFGTDYHANVQPYSGVSALLAVFRALLKPGDTVLTMSGSRPESWVTTVEYGLNGETELIDYDELALLARQARPKLIVCGTVPYPAHIDFQLLARIARESRAWLVVDISQFAGLIAAKSYPSPFGHADVVVTETQGTLRAGRGGIIFSRPEFAAATDAALSPGLQDGIQASAIAALGSALGEVSGQAYFAYVRQMLANAQALAYGLQQRGLRLISDGTDSHHLIIDLNAARIGDHEARTLLAEAGLLTSTLTIPSEGNLRQAVSGLMLGTASVTTRGLKEREMELLAEAVVAVLTTRRVDPAVQAEIAALARRFRIPTYL